jgi:hypothetical protein
MLSTNARTMSVNFDLDAHWDCQLAYRGEDTDDPVGGKGLSCARRRKERGQRSLSLL